MPITGKRGWVCVGVAGREDKGLAGGPQSSRDRARAPIRSVWPGVHRVAPLLPSLPTFSSARGPQSRSVLSGLE